MQALLDEGAEPLALADLPRTWHDEHRFEYRFGGVTEIYELGLGGVEQSQGTLERKLGTGTDVGSGSGLCLVDVTTGATDLDLRVKCDGATDDFNLAEGQLVAIRIGST